MSKEVAAVEEVVKTILMRLDVDIPKRFGHLHLLGLGQGKNSYKQAFPKWSSGKCPSN